MNNPQPHSLRVLAATLVLFGVAACSTHQDTRITGPISLTYLQKQGDQQYFLDEAAGAKARAQQLGIDLTMVDLGNDQGKALSAEKQAIAQRTNGLIVVVPDPAVGPQVAKIAKDAKVALLTSDDQICTDLPDPSVCAHQNLLPRVGFSSEQLGTQVGQRAAQEFANSGWSAADTQIVAAWQPDVNVCRQRVDAADEAFLAATDRVLSVDVATDNTTTGAQSAVAARIAVTHGIKHWIVWGCNDENVQGATAALDNAGVQPKDIIGVGLGAYLACQDWRAGRPTAMRAALFINGADVGALAVQTMYDKLTTGKDFPAETFAPTTMVDASTWQTTALHCT
ncbi:L-arabinose transport system substrate-binding protein [Kitasatospora sp. MAP12-15]|uniref:substrate-binding domain-containing protein n=1 Tax=unclassified Kitasatospora TaxID=2633591 RepID=UPI002476AD5C|nr:substrate-binding domain-containing protein [Kitasatospora sp. MAP12-44]MDH6115344.1 L-arabinose transport system substrate-binding protein [Kitasatospora sp. MAP12-44]